MIAKNITNGRYFKSDFFAFILLKFNILIPLTVLIIKINFYNKS
jgi:hypothetical protein